MLRLDRAAHCFWEELERVCALTRQNVEPVDTAQLVLDLCLPGDPLHGDGLRGFGL